MIGYTRYNGFFCAKQLFMISAAGIFKAADII